MPKYLSPSGLFCKADRAYPKDIKPLTSLRFLAALSIVVFHYTYEFPFLRDTLPGRLYLGVDFFFILSGFILTHSYLRSIEEGNFSAHDFIIKRFARIYPVHIFSLFLSAGTTATTIVFMNRLFDSGDSPSCLLLSILLLQAAGLEDKLCFNDPSWSISAEWFAYLLFPALIHGILKLGKRSSLYAGMIILVLSLALSISGQSFTQLTTFGVIRILPEFLYGIGIYFLGRKYQLVYTNKGALSCLSLVLFFSLALGVPDILIVLLFGFIILQVAELSRKGLGRHLENPHLLYWGEASYSLYMLHAVIWEALPVPVMMRLDNGEKLFDPLFFLSCFFALLFTFIAAHLSYRHIEKPARVWICWHFAKAKPSELKKK